MGRKLSFLMAAFALVAVSAPVAANANARITDPPGVLLSPVNEPKLSATNIGAVTIQTSLGVITCGTFDLTAKLTANTGTTYKAVGVGLGNATMCHIGGKPVTVTDVTVLELHSATTLGGTLNWTLIADLPNGIVCHFHSPNMPYAVTGTDTIKITNGDFQGTPIACDPGFINGTFTLETDFSPFTQLHLD